MLICSFATNLDDSYFLNTKEDLHMSCGKNMFHITLIWAGKCFHTMQSTTEAVKSLVNIEVIWPRKRFEDLRGTG